MRGRIVKQSAGRWMVWGAMAALTWATPAMAQLTGTKNIPGDYADLAAAVTDLNTQGVGAGGVILNLVAGNPQTAPAGGYTINLAAGNATAANPITLRGNGNIITAPTPQTSGLLNDALIRIVGEDFVTVEGFDLRENAANTTTVAATNNMTEWGIALIYRSVTDGAQSVTLRNNTITLNRTYQNTFGIYANATHTLAAPTTSATASDPAGGNSGLVIRGNTIGNVNNGIVVVGPTAAANHNATVTIGGATPADGNTVSNYGTTGTFSGFANVSGSVNGIVVRNTRASEVANNTVTSSDGGTTAGTLRGIWLWAGSTAPTGTFTQTVRNNTVSVRSGVAATAALGIVVDSGASSPTATVAINDNTIASLGYTLASGTASGALTGISVNGSATAGPLVTQINGNRLQNLSVNTSGNLTLILNSFTRPANGTVTANDNAIVTGLTKTLAGGTVRCYDSFGSSPATVSETNSGNNFSNITLSGTGATVLDCWRSADGTTPGSRKTVSNNTFDNIENQTTGANTILTVSFSDSGFNGNVVSGNTVSNVRSTSATSTSTLVGITTSAQNQIFSGNTVRGLRAAGTNLINGISVTGATTQVLSGNKVYDLEHSNAAGTVNGILVSSGTTVNLVNNLIGDLRAPAANNGNAVVGINIGGGTTVTADFNTVRLNASSSGALFGSSALSAATSVNLTLRNNNLVNLSTPAGIGISAAYRRSTTTLTTYQAASNANNLAGPTLYFDGTNADLTIGDVRTRLAPRDANSISENPTFASTAGADANFLNISTATPTQLESGGVPVAGITTDFGGATRNATTPDIGAWEFAGQLLDLNPPSIVYTPLTPTTSTASRTLNVTINDASGVAGGATAPRIYFRKNAGSYFSTACTGTAPSYGCTIDNALIGGVAGGDTVNYFVIAQDVPGNVAANPGAGLVAANVNTVTTPPTTPAAYGIVVALSGTINVGTGEPITSLTNAGGLFETLNNGVLGGNLTVNITSDLSAETGAVALNQLAEEGAGAGSYTLTLRPVGARVVTGTPATGGRLIDLNGADRVTIDGLNTAGNSLLIRNGGVGEVVRYINDASGNQLMNTVLEGGDGVTAVNVSSGITTGNDDILIANNIVRDRTLPTAVTPFNAIGATSTSTTITNDRLVVRNNEIVNFVQAGVFIGVGSSAFTVRDNIVRRTAPSANATQLAIGINGFQGGTNEIIGNQIRDLPSTATATGRLTGIEVINGTGGSVLIEANRVEALSYTGTAGVGVYGVRSGTGTGGSSALTAIRDNVIIGLSSNTTSTSGQVTGIDLATHTQGVVATGNRISGLAHAAAAAVPIRGFLIGNTQPAAELRGNRVFGFAPGATATGAMAGVWFTGGSGVPASMTLINNYISIAPAASTAQPIYGIYDFGFATNVVRADYNSVYVGGNGSLAANTWGFLRGTVTPTTVTLRNNVFYNGRTGGTGNHFAIGDQSANTGSWTSNRNFHVGTGATEGSHFDLGTASAGTPVNFAAWQAGPPTRDADSSSAAAGSLTLSNYFVDAPAGNLNLLATAVGAVNAGAPIVGVTTDIVGTLRLDPPEVGAFELPVATLGVTPTTIDFGGVNVGSTSAVQTVTLSNSGNVALTVNPLTAAAAPFALAGGTCSSPPINLAAGASCTLQYSFSPAAAGPAAQTLTVTSSGQGSGTISLTGTGLQGSLSIAPTSLGFGNQVVGSSSAAQTVTLSNTGTATLVVDPLTAAVAPFARTGGSCSTAPISLDAGASCTLVYTFSPTAVGLASQDLTVTANAPGGGTIVLSGTGVQGNLTITPTSVGFGNVNVGTTSPEQTVTLANTGTASLDVTALTSATAPFARTATGSCAATLPITLAAGANCTLTYTYTPTVAGASNQNLTVTANAPGSGTIALSGTGVSGALSVTPNPVAFGNQRVGTTSTATTITLTNTGDGVLTVSALPDPAAPFARSGGSCAAVPFTLNAGVSCTLQYTFSPTATGAASGSVVIVSNPGGSTTLQLTGTGVQGSLVLPANVTFPAQPVGSTSAPLTATLTNSGTDSLQVTALTAAAAPFTQTGGTCAAVPFTLNAGGTCTLIYTFSPTTPGAASQAISVTADAPGGGSFTLSGTGAPSADLAISKTSNTALLGNGLIQYTLVVTNAGPSAVTGATVTDTFDTGFSGIGWTCVGINGGGCAGAGSGNISQAVNLPVGGAVIYSITATAPTPLPLQLSNTATVAVPAGVTDPVSTNNSSTVVDVIRIFANGFEGVTAQILEGTSGAGRSVALASSTLETAARSASPEVVAQFGITGNLAVVQVRRIAGEVQAQLLTRDPRGQWQVGSWQSVSAGAGLRFEWQTGAESGGVAQLSARLVTGS
jgi:hypothetical protein